MHSTSARPIVEGPVSRQETTCRRATPTILRRRPGPWTAGGRRIVGGTQAMMLRASERSDGRKKTTRRPWRRRVVWVSDTIGVVLWTSCWARLPAGCTPLDVHGLRAGGCVRRRAIRRLTNPVFRRGRLLEAGIVVRHRTKRSLRLRRAVAVVGAQLAVAVRSAVFIARVGRLLAAVRLGRAGTVGRSRLRGARCRRGVGRNHVAGCGYAARTRRHIADDRSTVIRRRPASSASARVANGGRRHDRRVHHPVAAIRDQARSIGDRRHRRVRHAVRRLRRVVTGRAPIARRDAARARRRDRRHGVRVTGA